MLALTLFIVYFCAVSCFIYSPSHPIPSHPLPDYRNAIAEIFADPIPEPEVIPTPITPTKNLKSLSITQLRSQAKARKVRNYQKLNKSQLLAALS